MPITHKMCTKITTSVFPSITLCHTQSVESEESGRCIFQFTMFLNTATVKISAKFTTVKSHIDILVHEDSALLGYDASRWVNHRAWNSKPLNMKP
jgi:hypothetical protein